MRSSLLSSQQLIFAAGTFFPPPPRGKGKQKKSGVAPELGARPQISSPPQQKIISQGN